MFQFQNAGPSVAKSPFLRASFSLAPVDKFDVAFERLAELIREEQEENSNANEEALKRREQEVL